MLSFVYSLGSSLAPWMPSLACTGLVCSTTYFVAKKIYSYVLRTLYQNQQTITALQGRIRILENGVATAQTTAAPHNTSSHQADQQTITRLQERIRSLESEVATAQTTAIRSNQENQRLQERNISFQSRIGEISAINANLNNSLHQIHRPQATHSVVPLTLSPEEVLQTTFWLEQLRIMAMQPRVWATSTYQQLLLERPLPSRLSDLSTVCIELLILERLRLDRAERDPNLELQIQNRQTEILNRSIMPSDESARMMIGTILKMQCPQQISQNQILPIIKEKALKNKSDRSLFDLEDMTTHFQRFEQHLATHPTFALFQGIVSVFKKALPDLVSLTLLLDEANRKIGTLVRDLYPPRELPSISRTETPKICFLQDFIDVATLHTWEDLLQALLVLEKEFYLHGYFRQIPQAPEKVELTRRKEALLARLDQLQGNCSSKLVRFVSLSNRNASYQELRETLPSKIKENYLQHRSQDDYQELLKEVLKRQRRKNMPFLTPVLQTIKQDYSNYLQRNQNVLEGILYTKYPALRGNLHTPAAQEALQEFCTRDEVTTHETLLHAFASFTVHNTVVHIQKELSQKIMTDYFQNRGCPIQWEQDSLCFPHPNPELVRLLKEEVGCSCVPDSRQRILIGKKDVATLSTWVVKQNLDQQRIADFFQVQLSTQYPKKDGTLHKESWRISLQPATAGTYRIVFPRGIDHSKVYTMYRILGVIVGPWKSAKPNSQQQLEYQKWALQPFENHYNPLTQEASQEASFSISSITMNALAGAIGEGSTSGKALEETLEKFGGSHDLQSLVAMGAKESSDIARMGFQLPVVAEAILTPLGFACSPTIDILESEGLRRLPEEAQESPIPSTQYMLILANQLQLYGNIGYVVMIILENLWNTLQWKAINGKPKTFLDDTRHPEVTKHSANLSVQQTEVVQAILIQIMHAQGVTSTKLIDPALVTRIEGIKKSTDSRLCIIHTDIQFKSHQLAQAYAQKENAIFHSLRVRAPSLPTSTYKNIPDVEAIKQEVLVQWIRDNTTIDPHFWNKQEEEIELQALDTLFNRDLWPTQERRENPTQFGQKLASVKWKQITEKFEAIPAFQNLLTDDPQGMILSSYQQFQRKADYLLHQLSPGTTGFYTFEYWKIAEKYWQEIVYQLQSHFTQEAWSAFCEEFKIRAANNGWDGCGQGFYGRMQDVATAVKQKSDLISTIKAEALWIMKSQALAAWIASQPSNEREAEPFQAWFSRVFAKEVGLSGYAPPEGGNGGHVEGAAERFATIFAAFIQQSLFPCDVFFHIYDQCLTKVLDAERQENTEIAIGHPILTDQFIRTHQRVEEVSSTDEETGDTLIEEMRGAINYYSLKQALPLQVLNFMLDTHLLKVSSRQERGRHPREISLGLHEMQPNDKTQWEKMIAQGGGFLQRPLTTPNKDLVKLDPWIYMYSKQEIERISS